MFIDLSACIIKLNYYLHHFGECIQPPERFPLLANFSYFFHFHQNITHKLCYKKYHIVYDTGEHADLIGSVALFHLEISSLNGFICQLYSILLAKESTEGGG